MAPLGTRSHAATHHDDVSPTASTEELWITKCAHVRAAAASIADGHQAVDGGGDSFESIVAKLLAAADEGDPLVANMALGALRDSLGRINSRSQVETCVKLVLQTASSSRNPSSRFQLLRHLIRIDKPTNTLAQTGSGLTDESEREEEDSSSDEDELPPRRPLYLESVLEHWASYERLHCAVMDDSMSNLDAVHEAIVCLNDIVKRVRSAGRRHAGLRGIVERTVAVVWSWQFTEETVPTFIACDLIDLVMDSRELFQQTADGGMQTWLRMTFALLKSPVSTLAIHLLAGESVASDTACAESFVSVSSCYPLLQKWVLLCCTTASVYLSAPAHAAPVAWSSSFSDQPLPSRSRLLDVLMEQDDILVDVAGELLAVSRLLETSDAVVPSKLRLYFDNELQPDLLFANLLRVFRDDHLVMLDMLMSSETRMLEYLLHYLRYAAASWPRTQLVWDGIDRTGSVMSVLIRLRLEMERLVNAKVFPYNPTPLLRRLQAVENLYESEESSWT